MKTDYADISIVLDRSGSMESVRADTIGGFNAFLKDQKSEPGEATLTLAQFDDVYEVVYQALPIAKAKPLTTKTFVPRGSTALLDAIGRTISETGARLAALDESQRPEKVIFVILTDGEENASQEFTTTKISEMIRHQRDVYNWEFVFLGANQDAIATASQMGVAAGSALTYAPSPAGVQAAMQSVSANIGAVRSKKRESMDFLESDRAKQKDAGA